MQRTRSRVARKRTGTRVAAERRKGYGGGKSKGKGKSKGARTEEGFYELDITNQGGWGGSSDWDNGSSESWQGLDNIDPRLVTGDVQARDLDASRRSRREPTPKKRMLGPAPSIFCEVDAS